MEMWSCDRPASPRRSGGLFPVFIVWVSGVWIEPLSRMPHLALHASCHDALDEPALEEDEDGEHRKGDHRRVGQNLTPIRVLSVERRDAHRQGTRRLTPHCDYRP